MNEALITLNSPAKVNLFLRVLKRRSDGYHELASLFQAIDLCDRLHLRRAENDRLTVTNSSLSTDRSNLIWKAIDLFRKKTACRFSVDGFLEKNIPLEAGLGGGSGNAATALWGMNVLAGAPLTEGELMALGAEIGSDVAFFFSSGVAYCSGRGERVQSLPTPSRQSQPERMRAKAVDAVEAQEEDLWIFKQQPGLSTPQVYQALKLPSLPERDPAAALAAFLAGTPVYFNDLEHSAFAVMPELLTLKLQLQGLGFKHVLLAGSGSSLIGIGAPQNDFSALVSGFSRRCRRLYRPAHAWY